MNFFKDDPNAIGKGELKYKGGYVLEIRLVGLTIYAKVRASMNDISYDVKITVDGTGNIVSAVCVCPKGKWLCSHMAASAIHVNKKGISKTDLPSTWIGKPRTAAKNDGAKRVCEYFPSPKPAFRVSPRDVSEEDVAFLLDNLGNCPMKWMLGPEPKISQENPLLPKSIEDILPLFLQSKESFVQACKVTCDQINWVAQNTTDQRASHIWGKLRRLRLTGSNFGKVLDAYNRNQSSGTPYPPSLFKSLKGEYQLGTKDSIIWGQVHEDVAIENYIERTKNQVYKIGLCLFECGFLGSSPDGFIIHDGTYGALEVKCPWKHRDDTVSEMITKELGDKQEKKDFFLKADGTMNKKHSYWHQVQAEISVMNVQWADFVVWTKTDLRIIRVEKDEQWGPTNIPKLTDFYVNVLLPNVCS